MSETTSVPGNAEIDTNRILTPEELLDDAFGHYAWTIIVTLFLLTLCLAGALAIASVYSRRSESYLVVLVGSLIGWAAGMIFSPYTDKEELKFVSIGKAISAFVSGYLISKLDRVLELSVFSKDGLYQPDWMLTGLFTAGFMVFALGTYSCRRYFDEKKADENNLVKKIEGNSADMVRSIDAVRAIVNVPAAT